MRGEARECRDMIGSDKGCHEYVWLEWIQLVTHAYVHISDDYIFDTCPDTHTRACSWRLRTQTLVGMTTRGAAGANSGLLVIYSSSFLSCASESTLVKRLITVRPRFNG